MRERGPVAKRLFALQMNEHIAVFEEDCFLPPPGALFTGRCCRQSTSCEANAVLVGIEVYILRCLGRYTTTLPEGQVEMPLFEVVSFEEALEAN